MAIRRGSAGAVGVSAAQSSTAILTGGLDLTSQALVIPNGNVIDCQNYEPGITGGYRRVDGYERRDGRSAPSAANYYNLPVNLAGSVATGNTITGATSGATAYVLQVNGTTEVVFTALSGAFVAGENILVGGAAQGATAGTPSINGALTLALHVKYRGQAAAYYRTQIQPVPGSGNILGVWLYDNVAYAFRNNAAGTAAVMYQESSAGWQPVAMPFEVKYSAGSGTQPAPGATIAQGGVSGTLKAITVESGTFTGGDAAGRMIFLAIAGGSFVSGAFTAGVTATCDGAQTQVVLLPNGSYNFDTYNFSGIDGASKMYGCDGVNRGFEFDGTTFMPIASGMAPDTPDYVRCYLNQLIYFFGGIFQNSALGNPYNWTLLLGAAQISMGDVVTAALPQVGTATQSGCLIICTRHSTWALYGSSPANWQLVPYSMDVGCVPGMAVQMMEPYFFSDRGLTQLKAVLDFGNFERSILTEKIQTFIQQKVGMGTTACVVRQKSHVRFFFNDGTFLIVGFVGGVAGDTGQYGVPADEQPDLMIGKYPVPVLCSASCETTNGLETMLFGSNDGYVYQADMGTSFDGQGIEAWVRSAYDAIGGPRIRKRFFSGEFEIKIIDQADLQIGYDTSYGDPDADQTPQASYTLAGAGGDWDSFVWDQFTWDAASVVTQAIDTPGRGRNIGYIVYSNTLNDSAWTLFSVTTRYENVRLMR